MKIDPSLPSVRHAEFPVSNQPRIRDREEAARQFEEILVKQFVQTMTDGMFNESLAGENGPGWMTGQQDMQKDTMAQILTEHLVAKGRLGIADQLLKQWQRQEDAEKDLNQSPRSFDIRPDSPNNTATSL